jgi:CheY-like chemotaxis protein
MTKGTTHSFDLAQRVLERSRCNVDVFEKSIKALEYLRINSSKYDLILCYIRMPDINGIYGVFAREVKNLNLG